MTSFKDETHATNPHFTLLKERLATLNASQLDIYDESHLHAGHAGNKGGASHFRATIVAECFSNQSMIAQHRLVYDLLRDLIPYPIHALALSTRAPSKGNS
ncbi:MAG: BolA family protein [Alcaligenaceae bacterium]|jgi:BolA protein